MAQDIKDDIARAMLETDDPALLEFSRRLLRDVREGERQLEEIQAARGEVPPSKPTP